MGEFQVKKPHPPMDVVAGLALKHYLTTTRQTQEEFAEEFGFDPKTISRYVNKGIQNIGTIEILAVDLGQDVMSFLQTGLRLYDEDGEPEEKG